MRPSHVSAASTSNPSAEPQGRARLVRRARRRLYRAHRKGAHAQPDQLLERSRQVAQWSADGSKILFISDLDGEEELYTISQDGSGKPEELTHDFHAMLYQPLWAPDGKRIAFSDAKNKLYVLTLDDKKVTTVAENPRGRVHDYAWSARAVISPIASTIPIISARSISGALSTANPTASPMNISTPVPSWDPKATISTLSTRTFYPQLSLIEFNYATNRGDFVAFGEGSCVLAQAKAMELPRLVA